MTRYDRQLALMRRVDPAFRESYFQEMDLVDAWLASAPEGARPRVLDAGCGLQYGLVVRYRPRLWSVGIDLDAPAVRRNRDLDAKAVADCTAIPLRAGSVDLVFCRFVLEHLPDPARAVREFARVLRPGGVAVLSTVNVRNPAMWGARFAPRRLRTLIRGASFGRELEDNAPAFYRANTERRLRGLFEGEGFRLSRCDYFPTFVWYFRFATPLLLLLTALNRVAAALGLRRYYGGIVFAAHKPAPRAAPCACRGGLSPAAPARSASSSREPAPAPLQPAGRGERC